MTATMRQSSRSFASAPVWHSCASSPDGCPVGPTVWPASEPRSPRPPPPLEEEERDEDDDRDEPASAAERDRHPAGKAARPLSAVVLDLRRVEPRVLAEAHPRNLPATGASGTRP